MEKSKSKSKTEKFNMEIAIRDMLIDTPFLGYVFSSLKRKESKKIPTAAITPDNILMYNRKFFADLNKEEAKYVLFHEVLHKMNNHFDRFDDIFKMSTGVSIFDNKAINEKNLMEEAQVLMHNSNIAADCAINQICDVKFTAPKDLVTLESFQKNIGNKLKPIVKVKANMEFEYYYDLMNKLSSKDRKNGQNKNSDHNGNIKGGKSKGDGKDKSKKKGKNGEGTSDTDRIMQKEEFRNIVKKAIDKQKMHEALCGSGSGSLLDILPDINVKVKDKNLWTNAIAKRFGNKRTNRWNATMKRPKRRDSKNPFGRVRRKITNHNIVIIDTSSSCLSYIDKFLGCIERACRKYSCSVDLLFTNTSVYGIHKNQKRLNPKNYQMIDGGTDLTTAQQYIIDNYDRKLSNVVCITDGYTNWLQKEDGYNFNTTCIYTSEHDLLPGISNYAVIED